MRGRSSPSGGTTAPAASRSTRYRSAPSPTHSWPGSGRRSSGAQTRGSGSATKTSPPRASITGSAPGAPTASTARLDTGAASMPSAIPRPRAAASPTRRPVKDPGPIPTASASSARGPSPTELRSASASARIDAARDGRSPTSSPSRTSATDASGVAVSKAKSSMHPFYQRLLGRVDVDDPVSLVVMLQPDAHPRLGQRPLPRLRPLDEGDRALEVRLEIAPLRRREALEAVEVEVGD